MRAQISPNLSYKSRGLADVKRTFFTASQSAISPLALQLACIVNMVPRWKRLQIRAFILVRSDNPNPDLLQRQRELVVKMLELLRIRAEAVALQWTPEGPRASMSDETSTG